jgi:hypothetical protein
VSVFKYAAVINVKGGENMKKEFIPWEFENKEIFLKLYLSSFTSGLTAALGPVNSVIFLCICSFMSEGGECHPSIRQIAKYCGVSKRTVTRSIKELIEFRVDGKPILTREFIKDGDQILYTKYKVQPISQIAIFNGEIESIPVV